MQGMPMSMPSVTFTQCMTSDDPVPVNSKKGQDCKVRNIRKSGRTMQWDLVCRSDQGDMNGHGRVTYNGDRMDGVMTMEMKMNGQGTMHMKTSMTGHRIGPCKK